ncbi:flavodoxin family protein [Haploplasma axanthum]|uniref:Flavodoxin n=1 Tax=Haploplasma axanthum TaxID=29552 RepID=A0A449BFH6_HAPAX|nr:flavodoxin family protein [Haploplasma axanthum]VEU81192.1 flavodoxin [Haploplasma axanthum]
MKIALIYSSLTGNTEKVAKAIFDSLPGEKALFRNKKDNYNLDDFDIIIIGYWCRRTFMDPLSIDLVKKIKGKKVAAFGTAGMYPDSKYGELCRERVRNIIEEENEFIGDFLCQGKIPEERTNKRLNLPKDDPHYLDEEGLKRHIESRKHPNNEDFIAAQEAFRKIISNHVK